ncbi:AMP-binding protein, partial [Chloroflexota bacterium]
LSSMRLCISSGEALPAPVFYKWKETFGQDIVEGIGSTDTWHVFCSNRPGLCKPGSMGYPVPAYEVRIVDDAGKECPVEKMGHLVLRGPTGTRYWRLPEKQREGVKDGWCYLGDIAYKDKDGYFWHVARMDDDIKSSGYRIGPLEIERVLLEHAAVLECAVVGVPDSMKGQKVKAFVVLRQGFEPGEELVSKLKDLVGGQLAHFKVPREFEFIEDIPKTATGKLMRKELRRREEENARSKSS